MKQFMIFVKKEFKHVFRDSKTLLMLFGLPIVQIVLFGFALSNEIKSADVLICDHANNNYSHEIIHKISASKSFEVKRVTTDHSEIEEAFKQGSAKIAIVIPSDIEDQIFHSTHGSLQVISDASDPNTASTLTSYISNIIMDYKQTLNAGNSPPMQVVPEIRMLYNPTLKGATNFVPGVISLVLLLVCVLMTSVSIVKEKESGSMEILLVSPMNPFTVIISKAVPYFFLSLINLTVILIMSVVLLDMPLNGSIFLLYFESSILILCALSLGLLISNSTDSQQAAMLISLMGMLIPTMLLTGFLFPLENMPLPLQYFANILPSKWYFIIVKSIMIKGLGISAIYKETLILIGMTVLLLFISIRKFKIRLS
ncbi:ABC transporter permease [Portibacter lacus]|uniref:Transport permease protein n=1 Tax=Portibacter lacus TaxID=1099794 RepID=A0AA37SKU8_9BACT|nr:ABC transporter permease [Portibacter lacus]GLR15745.1 transport permease protein [Portibacter lacus]